MNPPSESVVDRFLRYVRVDTQSLEDSSTTPSTDSQWALSKQLVDELRSLGAEDVRLSEHCMIYATIPSNLPANAREVPAIGLLAHVDTSPAVSGAGVKPIVHRDYRGGDIALPGDPSQVITVAQKSVKLWTASDRMPSEPVRRPAASFARARPALANIETRATDCFSE